MMMMKKSYYPPPPIQSEWEGNAIIGDNEFMTYNDIDEEEYGNNTTKNYSCTPEEECDMHHRHVKYYVRM